MNLDRHSTTDVKVGGTCWAVEWIQHGPLGSSPLCQNWRATSGTDYFFVGHQYCPAWPGPERHCTWLARTPHHFSM